MKYFKGSAWAIIAFALFLQPSPVSAAFDAFDAAVLIKKSFWKDVANALPLAAVDLPSGKVTIVGAALCDVQNGSARFLVAFKAADPKSTSVAQGDCSKSLTDIISANTDAHYDGLALVSVKQGNPGLEVAVTDAAVKPTGTSTSLLQEVQSYKKTFALQNIDLGEEYTRDAEASVNFLQDGLIFLIRNSSMPHSLQASDVPTDFTSLSSRANSEIIISHDALSKIAADKLSKKAFPLGGKLATVKIISYSGSNKKIIVHADVNADIESKRYDFKGTATWSGANLQLSDTKLKSQWDCSKTSGLTYVGCKAVETAGAALPSTCGCVPPQIAPLTSDKKFEFEIYKKKVFFAAQTISTTSNAKALIVMLDSKVGAGH